jgi:hypothetical protein
VIRPRRLLALLALLAPAASAWAQDRPLLLPARDVDVTYDIAGTNALLHQRLRWDVADRLLRVDPPGAGLYMIVNYAEDRLSVVRAQDRSVLRLPAAAARLPGAGATRFARLGERSIAGLACTEWRTEDTAGLPAELCLTADGVLLGARSGMRVMLAASRVDYAPQPAVLFQVPDDYRVVAP